MMITGIVVGLASCCGADRSSTFEKYGTSGMYIATALEIIVYGIIAMTAATNLARKGLFFKTMSPSASAYLLMVTMPVGMIMGITTVSFLFLAKSNWPKEPSIMAA